MLVLALLGSLVACGDNTDLDRGETNCDSAGKEAANSQDASCQETGTPGDGGDRGRRLTGRRSPEAVPLPSAP